MSRDVPSIEIYEVETVTVPRIQCGCGDYLPIHIGDTFETVDGVTISVGVAQCLGCDKKYMMAIGPLDLVFDGALNTEAMDDEAEGNLNE